MSNKAVTYFVNKDAFEKFKDAINIPHNRLVAEAIENIVTGYNRGTRIPRIPTVKDLATALNENSEYKLNIVLNETLPSKEHSEFLEQFKDGLVPMDSIEKIYNILATGRKDLHADIKGTKLLIQDKMFLRIT